MIDLKQQFSRGEVCEIVAMGRGRLTDWVNRGIITPVDANPGTGARRTFTINAVLHLAVMSRLVDAGLLPGDANPMGQVASIILEDELRAKGSAFDAANSNWVLCKQIPHAANRDPYTFFARRDGYGLKNLEGNSVAIDGTLMAFDLLPGLAPVFKRLALISQDANNAE